MIKIRSNIEITIQKDCPNKCHDRCRHAKHEYDHWKCTLFNKRTDQDRLPICMELFGTVELGVLTEDISVEELYYA